MTSHDILCVDPDPGEREATITDLREALSDLDVTIEGVDSIEAACSALETDLSVLVTEYDLPDGTGLDLIRVASEACPDAGCVLYTATDPDTIDTDPLRGSLTEYVGKGSVFGTERLARLLRTTAESAVQTSYPLPQNEDERLAALQAYDLDDPQLLSSLDCLSTLAADHFGVEQTSVSVMEEHSQEFLACFGGAKEWGAVDREDSICTFTILEDDDVMTVPDVTEDPRFESRSEGLIDLGVRAYMGANIVTSAGLVVGSFCVYDDEPRTFSPADEDYLRRLASVTSDFLELHARLEVPATEGAR